MEKDICKFDLLIVTTELNTLDSFGMMIYSKCPNYNLHFAANVVDAINKIKMLDPDVLVVDDGLRKLASFQNLEEILRHSKGTIFFLTVSESREVHLGSVAALTISKTISAEDLQQKLNDVAVELFWKKAASAGALKPVPAFEAEEEPR